MFNYMKCLLISGVLLIALVGCGDGRPSPAEIKARQQAAMESVAKQLAELESKEKKPPLSSPSKAVIEHGPVGFDPAVVLRGLEVFFNEGVPESVSGLHPFRYQEVYCDQSETVSLAPEESEEFGRLFDFYFSKQYGPWSIHTFIGAVHFKITWYDADGNEYVSSSVPDDLERKSDALSRLVASFGPRCLTVPMLLDSLRDEDPCMRNFALHHMESRVRADRECLAFSEGAVPALLTVLWDQELPLRILAADCLFMLFDERHVNSERATDAVLRIAKAGGKYERRSAISALSSSSASKSNDVVDALLVALRDEYQGVRYKAASVLRNYRDMPQRAEGIVAGLTEALGDEDESVRIMAAKSLKEFE